MTNEKRRGVFHFDCNIDCRFSHLGDSTLVLRRFVHVADFGNVPCSLAGFGVRPPSGGRESGHAEEQEHHNYRKGGPGNCEQTFHAFLEESRVQPANMHSVTSSFDAPRAQEDAAAAQEFTSYVETPPYPLLQSVGNVMYINSPSRSICRTIGLPGLISSSLERRKSKLMTGVPLTP